MNRLTNCGLEMQKHRVLKLHGAWLRTGICFNQPCCINIELCFKNYVEAKTVVINLAAVFLF